MRSDQGDPNMFSQFKLRHLISLFPAVVMLALPLAGLAEEAAPAAAAAAKPTLNSGDTAWMLV